MDNFLLSMISIVGLVSFALLGIPLAISMAMIGLVGGIYLSGAHNVFNYLGMYINSNLASYTLSAIPFFLLMGQIVAKSGVSEDLYKAANMWLGRLRAGLCIVTIASCAAFAACCGSSQATTGTLGGIAIPQMKKIGYHMKIISGTLAAGGTLGILIPPSLGLLIYGVVTEQAIGKLFMAGILPGILLSVCFIVTAIVWAWLKKDIAPPVTTTYSLKEKLLAIKGVLGILVLFVLVLGGIYTGIFTPTESAAIGSFGAFLIMVSKRTFSLAGFYDCLMVTARVTGMLFLMILGAFLFQFFIAQTQLPVRLVEILSNPHLNRYVVLLILLAVFMILGFVMDGMALMILIVPIVAPIISALGFDLIWFGVVMVVVVEMSFITPPVGFNLFVIKSVAPDIKTSDMYSGIFPFLFAQIVCLVILILFPSISLYLPNHM